MKYLSITLGALIAIVAVGSANAQTNNTAFRGVKDRNGNDIVTREYSEVKGTAYLTDDWAPGTVKLANGSSVKDVSLKYDLVKDQLFFTDSSKEMYSFGEPVVEFIITYKDKDKDDETVTKHFRRGYTGISRTTADSYFEVLADGTAQLLKKTDKGIVITQEYNSATKVKNFKDDTNYYLVIGGKATSVRGDKKSIIAALPGKQQQLQDYVKANKIGKSDSDLSKLVTYYNSL